MILNPLKVLVRASICVCVGGGVICSTDPDIEQLSSKIQEAIETGF